MTSERFANREPVDLGELFVVPERDALMSKHIPIINGLDEDEDETDDEKFSRRPGSAPPSHPHESWERHKMQQLIASGLQDIRADPNYYKFYTSSRDMYPDLPLPFEEEFYRGIDRTSEQRYVDDMFSHSSEDTHDSSPSFSPRPPSHHSMGLPGYDTMRVGDSHFFHGHHSTGGAQSSLSMNGVHQSNFNMQQPNPDHQYLASGHFPDFSHNPFYGAPYSHYGGLPQAPAPDPFRPPSSIPAPIPQHYNPNYGSVEDPPSSPIWRPLHRTEGLNVPRVRNKSLGKISINEATQLSTSTDDLLSLAGGAAHVLRDTLRIPESPPTSFTPPNGSFMRDRFRISQREDFTPPVIRAHTQEPTMHSDEAELPFSLSPDVPHYLHPMDPRLPPLASMRNHAAHGSMSIHNGGMSQMNNPPPPIASLPLPPLNSIPNGSQIPQSNSLAPLPVAPSEGSSPRQRQACKFYAAGYCSKGDQCGFRHIDKVNQASVPNAAHLSPSKTKVPSSHPSKYQNITLEECRGQIAAMCLDQYGCRFLQKELEDDDDAKRDIIFAEVLDHVGQLMSDPFGNYLCQKMIERASDEQRLRILQGCTEHLVSISKNMHGTRAVQKLIEYLTNPKEISYIRESLKGNVVSLIQDLNGNHVIQKCLLKMEPNDNQFIYDAVAQHCVQVATHRHGCCVFQRCVDHATLDQKRQLIEEIKNHGYVLVQDAYGNYVVQYVLDLLIPNLPTDLIERLQGKLYFLSRQKFSSNVVEKCLKVGNHECALRIMRELLFEDPHPQCTSELKERAQEHLFSLLQDSFGNYVVQTCLSEGAEKAPREYVEMADLLRPVVHQLSRNVPYMRRIQSLLSLPVGSGPSSQALSSNARKSGGRNSGQGQKGRPRKERRTSKSSGNGSDRGSGGDRSSSGRNGVRRRGPTASEDPSHESQQ